MHGTPTASPPTGAEGRRGSPRPEGTRSSTLTVASAGYSATPDGPKSRQRCRIHRRRAPPTSSAGFATPAASLARRPRVPDRRAEPTQRLMPMPRPAAKSFPVGARPFQRAALHARTRVEGVMRARFVVVGVVAALVTSLVSAPAVARDRPFSTSRMVEQAAPHGARNPR